MKRGKCLLTSEQDIMEQCDDSISVQLGKLTGLFGVPHGNMGEDLLIGACLSGNYIKGKPTTA